MVSWSSRHPSKSSSRNKEQRRTQPEDEAPRTIYQPRSDAPRAPRLYETSVEQAARLCEQAKDNYRLAFTKYDEAAGLNDVRRTIDSIGAAGVGPSMAYPPYFADRIVAHPFPPNFKLTNSERYDGTTDPAIWISDYILAIQVANGDDYHASRSRWRTAMTIMR